MNKVVCVSCFHLSLASRLLFSNKSSVQFIRVTWKLIYTTQEHCWLWTSFCRLAKLHIYLFVCFFICLLCMTALSVSICSNTCMVLSLYLFVWMKNSCQTSCTDINFLSYPSIIHFIVYCCISCIWQLLIYECDDDDDDDDDDVSTPWRNVPCLRSRVQVTCSHWRAILI